MRFKLERFRPRINGLLNKELFVYLIRALDVWLLATVEQAACDKVNPKDLALSIDFFFFDFGFWTY